jgi:NodT family efflux transporter outer membrane factor (OMF) lipoprotein
MIIPHFLSPPKADRFMGPILRIAPAGVSALCLTLAGCAALPEMDKASQIQPPSHYASGSSFQANAAPWPQADWWRAYGDPQLDLLIDTALAGTPDLRAAQARLAKAQAQSAQSQAVLMPSLSASASVSEAKQSYYNGIPPQFVPKGMNDQGQGSLNLSFDLDLWGKNRRALEASVSLEQAAAADAALARITLASEIAASYADFAGQFDARDAQADAVRVKAETYDLVQSRVNSGLDTQAELKQAEAGLYAARADLARAEEAIDLTRHRIAALLGEGPDRGLTLQRPKTIPTAFGLPANLALDLIGHRPDIVAARWRVEAASSRIGVAKAAFYPNVNLTAALGVQALYLNRLTQAGADTASIGPAISLPIFDGGSLRANLSAAHADYAEGVANYDAALTQALQQVADAVTSQKATTERLRQAQAALAASEAAHRLAGMRYRSGLSTYQSVLSAETAEIANRQSVAELSARRFSLDVALNRALGGGWPQV